LLAGPVTRMEAQDRAQLVLAQDPNNVDAHVLLANAEAAMGETVEAVKEMQLAIQLAPDRSTSYLNLGRLQIDAKQIPAAEQSSKRPYN